MIERRGFSFIGAHRTAKTSLGIASTLLVVAIAHAQDTLEPRIGYVTQIGGGYNASDHTYERDFIERNLTRVSHRPVRADVCRFLTSRKVRMIPLEDGGAPCAEQTVLQLPSGINGIALTLTGPHPLLKKTIDLEQFRVPTEIYRGNNKCKPVELLPTVTACSTVFSVPIPSPSVVNPPTVHAIKAEAFGSGGQLRATKTKPVAVPARATLIVSVGESLAAGEGNPDNRGRSRRRVLDPSSQRDCFDDTSVMIVRETKPDMIDQPRWYDERDHRSLHSGPAIAARNLLDRWPYIVFLSFAKSGAKVSDIVAQLGNVQAVIGDHKIDALLISAGGNDVGFSNVLKDMAGDFAGRDAQQAMSLFLRKILDLRDVQYPKLNQAIVDLKLNVAPGAIVINEYPGNLFNREDGQPAKGCGVFDTLVFWGVKKADAVAMRDMGELLNAEVKLLADKHRWIAITNLSEKFATHGYCSKTTYYRSAEDSCDMQGDFNGTMHPNSEGTAVYARALERVLRQILPAPLPGFKR